MAALKKPEVIVSNDRCIEVTKILEKEKVISVDVEGDSLGATGPITLLQIATVSHDVYIFDIQANPNMLKATRGLKELLESQDLVKVIHASENESNALYHQYKIELQNVFDTQVAHVVIEEKKGTLFPPTIKLSDINEIYGGQENVFKSSQKKWLFVSGYWCQRPLTDEMVNYCSGDVISLIPDVYNKQLGLLADLNASVDFKAQVEESLRRPYDYANLEKSKSRTNDRIKVLISSLDEKRAGKTNGQVMEMLTDDDKNGLWGVKHNEGYPFSIPRWFRDIQESLMREYVLEMKADVSTKGLSVIDLDDYLTRRLKFLANRNMAVSVRNEARRLLQMLQAECFRRMEKALATGQPIQVSHKLELFFHNPTYSGRDKERLVAAVIRNVACEIQDCVGTERDLNEKLKKLTQFHKQFLITAPMHELSDEMKRLKRMLPNKMPPRFVLQ